MQNNLKEKKMNLIKKYCETNPNFESGKKLVFYLLLTIVLSRVVHSVCQVAYYIANGISISPIGIFVTIFQVLIALFFAFLIHYGTKPVVYLALFGGGYSLYSAYRNNISNNLHSADSMFNILNWMFLTVILIQIVVMLFLLLNKKTNDYFKIMENVRKDMSSWLKNNSSSL